MTALEELQNIPALARAIQELQVKLGQAIDTNLRTNEELRRLGVLVTQQDQRLAGLASQLTNATAAGDVLPARVSRLEQVVGPFSFEDIDTRLKLQFKRITQLEESLAAGAKTDVDADAVDELRKKLFGDPVGKAAYEHAKKTGTWPNHPGPKLEDPPPGVIETMQGTLDRLVEQVKGYQGLLDGKLSFINRLEQFFGPFMAKHPNTPLDGDQIATKAFVDESVTRIAGTLRAEVSKRFVEHGVKLGVAYDVARELVDAIGAFDLSRDNSASTHAKEVGRKIKLLWDRFEQSSKPRSGGLGSFVYSILGDRISR